MSLYTIPITLQNDTISDLSPYKGNVLLIVNTATGCGLTPQYTALQELYDAYHSQGFEVLDFPCNQFNNQAPEADLEINKFCTLNYNTTFPRFKKVEVNGENACQLFKFLKEQKGGLFNDEIKWNFTKFLIDKQGHVIKRYAPQTSPENIAKDIENLL